MQQIIINYVKVFNCSFTVPALIVDCQNADLILGSNVIKHLIHDMKVSSDFWGKVFDSRGNDPDKSALMQLLSKVETLKGTDPPYRSRYCKTEACCHFGTHERTYSMFRWRSGMFRFLLFRWRC